MTALKRRLRRFAIVLSLSAALACVHKNPPPDFAYDHTTSFANLTTYAWFEDPNWKMPEGNSIVDGQFIDREVRQAVDANLQKKGYRKVDGDATFYVAYHPNAAGVLSQDKWGVYNWWSWSYIGYSGTKYQKQGNLVLDVRDAHKALVWRGARTAMIGTNPEALNKDIDAAVKLLLAQFPPQEAK